jgi:hypothetical protein
LRDRLDAASGTTVVCLECSTLCKHQNKDHP